MPPRIRGPGASGRPKSKYPGRVLNDPPVDDLHVRLEDERTQLSTQLSSLDHRDPSNAFDENFADSGQVAAEQGENHALSLQLREQLDDVERALGKLDAGTYGQCEVCSGQIGEARIEAMPAARFCIDHAG